MITAATASRASTRASASASLKGDDPRVGRRARVQAEVARLRAVLVALHERVVEVAVVVAAEDDDHARGPVRWRASRIASWFAPEAERVNCQAGSA